MLHKILLIEDAQDVQRIVSHALNLTATVTCVATIAEAEQELKRQAFDLILLDVILPDGDGFKYCAELQKSEATCEIPVIFLTGKAEVTDKVIGFSLGAEDYIQKPFDPSEMIARVNARLKKLRTKKSHQEIFRRGDLKINSGLQRAHLIKGEVEVALNLTPVEFKLLYLFLRGDSGTIFTREQLIRAVWGDQEQILDRTIDSHVSNLRKKIAPSLFSIRSVHGVGYRIVESSGGRSGEAA